MDESSCSDIAVVSSVPLTDVLPTLMGLQYVGMMACFMRHAFYVSISLFSKSLGLLNFGGSILVYIHSVFACTGKFLRLTLIKIRH